MPSLERKSVVWTPSFLAGGAVFQTVQPWLQTHASQCAGSAPDSCEGRHSVPPAPVLDSSRRHARSSSRTRARVFSRERERARISSAWGQFRGDGVCGTPPIALSCESPSCGSHPRFETVCHKKVRNLNIPSAGPFCRGRRRCRRRRGRRKAPRARAPRRPVTRRSAR